MNTLCNGFDYQARYSAPETYGAPLMYRAGNLPFPTLAFWRYRYGFRGPIPPQWAEYLSLDFQPLEGFATGVVTRILDFLYESPCGGSVAEREAVLTELSQFVDVASHFRLRVTAELSDGRSWRCHFFQRVNTTDIGFWQRLALVYASLAPKPAAMHNGDPDRPWCHALVEEARFWQAPICTQQWMEALSTAPEMVRPPAVPVSPPHVIEQFATHEVQPEPNLPLPAPSIASATQSEPDVCSQEADVAAAAPLSLEDDDRTTSTTTAHSWIVSTSLAVDGIQMNITVLCDSLPKAHPHSPIQKPLICPYPLTPTGPCGARASPDLSRIRSGRDPPKIGPAEGKRLHFIIHPSSFTLHLPSVATGNQ